MTDPRKLIHPYLPSFKKNWVWFFGWGLLLILLGVFALFYSTITTLVSIVILGFVIFASGIVIILDALTFWRGKYRSFFIHFLMGALYLLVGLWLIASPALASSYLTLLLGIFYILIGVTRIVHTFYTKTPSWGWGFFSGLTALVLGILILLQWPSSSLFIIGLFIGIDLVFIGFSYILLALTGRNYKLSF